jgi:hypothetical protein
MSPVDLLLPVLFVAVLASIMWQREHDRKYHGRYLKKYHKSNRK